MSLDRNVTAFIRSPELEFLAPFMVFVDFWGMSYMMVVSVLVIALIFYLASYKKEAFFALSVFAADIINVFLKLLFNRPRPEAIEVFPAFQQASFPSGHVVHYTVFFGFIAAVMLINQRIPMAIRWIAGGLSLLLVAGVGFARVYSGTHWPTDVIVAYLVGGVMLAILVWLYKRQLT